MQAGTAVEIDVRDGVVSIEPAAAEVRISRRGKLRVAVPVTETPPLTEEEVRAVRESVRRR